jgi:hypothetical protein
MRTSHLSLPNKEHNMDKILSLILVAMAAITVWAVLTPNHLFVG